MKKQTIQKMSSGHFSLTLVENVESKDFSSLAKQWSAQLGAKVHIEASNFDVQLWKIELSGEDFFLGLGCLAKCVNVRKYVGKW